MCSNVFYLLVMYIGCMLPTGHVYRTYDTYRSRATTGGLPAHPFGGQFCRCITKDLHHRKVVYNGMTTTVPFINSLSSGVNSSTVQAYHTHDTEREHTHSHGLGEHGHTHEHLDHPGGSFRSSMIRMLMSVSHRQILRT